MPPDPPSRLGLRPRVTVSRSQCPPNHPECPSGYAPDDHSRFQRDIDDVTGVSLSLYYSQKSLTHNIGSASALPIIYRYIYILAVQPGVARAFALRAELGRFAPLALLSFLASRSLNPEMNRLPDGKNIAHRRAHITAAFTLEKEAILISNGKIVTQVEHHGVQYQLGEKDRENSQC